MTREKAIEIIKDYKVGGCGYCHQGGDEVEEAFQMAIKALEQQSCDDCISRVLEYIEGSNAELGHSTENELVCQDIKELLPVIPTRKTGRWLKGNSYGDQYNYYQSYVCSCCKREYDVHGWKYCPNCGAKMESEE